MPKDTNNETEVWMENEDDKEYTGGNSYESFLSIFGDGTENTRSLDNSWLTWQ